MNPYRLPEQNTIICFSGGRSSGYMLWHILDAFSGTLPDWIRVLFANTGAEREETLRFVDRLAREWNIPIVWLERSPDSRETNLPARTCVTDFESASRNNEPFRNMLKERSQRILPGPVRRACMEALKVMVCSAYAKRALGWKHYSSVFGFRADERHRLEKMLIAECPALEAQEPLFDDLPEHKRTRQDYSKRKKRRPGKGGLPAQAPMVDALVTQSVVQEWWRGRPDDLGIPSWWGNCGGCFMLSEANLVQRERERPGTLAWMAEMEEHYESLARHPTGARWNRDGKPYKELIRLARTQMHIDEMDVGRKARGTCHVCTD